MMQLYEVLQTEFRGVVFRSKTEARWAAFFYKLGVRYEYEPEAFVFPKFKYMPDFYLPDFPAYIEVKGRLFTAKERYKCMQFTKLSGHSIMLADGWPDYRGYEVIYQDTCSGIKGIDSFYALPGYKAENRFYSIDANWNISDQRYLDAISYSQDNRFKWV